jgi:6-pyruvoyl tetrahydropterin synthase.
LQDLDHNCLNDILPNPTAETIAQWISERLKKDMETTSVRLFSLKLWEGKNKWVMIE